MKLFYCLGLLGVMTLQNGSAAIEYDGVLGNSGEQGASLIRYGSLDGKKLSITQRREMGVIFDTKRTFWASGGDGTVNRYSLDGRLLKRLEVAKKGSQNDALLASDGKLIIVSNGKVYTYPFEAKEEVAPEMLKLEVGTVSKQAREGWVLSVLEDRLFKFNLAGEVVELAKREGMNAPFWGKNGEIYCSMRGSGVEEFKPGAEGGEGVKKKVTIGGRPDFVEGFYYGFDYHGTIRRFDEQFALAPGVVLGGNNGSFIGHLEGDYELNLPAGIVHLEGNLFATTGSGRVIHFLSWDPVIKRFEIIERIGGLPYVESLAIDSTGRVWCNFGVWEPGDNAMAPLKFGIPGGPGPSYGSVMIDEHLFIPRPGHKKDVMVLNGTLDKLMRYKQSPLAEIPPQGRFSALTWKGKSPILSIFNEKGEGRGVGLGMNGALQKESFEVILETQSPVTRWSSFAGRDSSRSGASGDLIASGDGAIIEMETSGSGFKEKARWNSWEPVAAYPGSTQFGPEIEAAVARGYLWVADTQKHRILCFDLQTRKLLGSFGVDGQAKDDLAGLNSPKTIATSGTRAAVFDSGNQRLIRLKLAD